MGTVEKRKKFPDRKKKPCSHCGRPWMIEISSDLWEVFDMIAMRPMTEHERLSFVPDIVLVQVTSRDHHATRRNKILGSMEAKLALLSGARVLIQSWRQDDKTRRWQEFDEWITLDQFKQAVSYPNTVAELVEIRRKAKMPDLPPGSDLEFCKGTVDFSDIPF